MLNRDPKTGKMTSAANDLASESIKGVSILGFSTKSLAQEAGLQKGDVIIQYDGRVNLTTRKLTTLSKTAKFEGISPRVVFVRDGCQRSLILPPGPLGISAMDTTIHGPLINREDSPEMSSIERLVQFIRSELVQFTPKSTLRSTLVKKGWDKKEAALFIEQIADEMKRDPRYLLKRMAQYKRSVKWVIPLLLLYGVTDIAYSSDFDDAMTWGSFYALIAGAVIICAFSGWIVNYKRLNRLVPETDRPKRQASSFRPTMGNLNITERCRSWQELADDVWEIVWITVHAILLLMVLALFAVIVLKACVLG